MSRIGKTELAKLVADRTDLPPKTAQQVVGEVFDAIARELADGNSIAIRGFGTWRTKVQRARKGRDPRTGEELQIQARAKIGFKPGASLRDSVESSMESQILLDDAIATDTEVHAMLNHQSAEKILRQVRWGAHSLLGLAAAREGREFFSADGEDRKPQRNAG
jgi:nucleoid DNA-binding protein